MNLVLNPEVLITELKLQRPSVMGDKIRAICPRKHLDKNGELNYERNPSFAINIEIGWYHCFACGLSGSNLNDLASELGVILNYVPRTYAQFFKRPVIPFELDFIRYNEDKAATYLKSRGITDSVIDECMPGASSDGNEIYLPIWDYKGNAVGYTKKDLVTNQWQLREGMEREHLLYGAHEPVAQEEFTYLVESGPDKLQLNSWGLKAKATLSAGVKDSQIEMFIRCSGKNVVIVEQNDAPGRKWGRKVRNYLRGRKIVWRVDIPPHINDVNQLGAEFLTLDMYLVK